MEERVTDRDALIGTISPVLGEAIRRQIREGHTEIAIERAQEDGFLQVSVTDDGVGIGPEDQDKLFRRFFRAATAAQTGASGAGLGLYITRAIVELHGGRIWFESESGNGSAFYVTFPISE